MFKNKMKYFRWASISFLYTWTLGIVISYLPSIKIYAGKVITNPSYYGKMSFLDRVLNVFFHYDAIIYSSIPLSGYSGNIYAFFPGWIGILKLLSITFGLYKPEWIAFAGGMVNFGFLALAIFSWSKVAELYHIKGVEKLIVFYPTSVFFVTAYPETMMLALGGIILFFCLNDKKWQCLLLLPFFVLAKHAGLIMGTSFVIWALFCRRHIFFWVLSGWLIGAISVFSFYFYISGDPFIWFKSQAAWHRTFSFPWNLFFKLRGEPADFILYLIVLFAVPVGFSYRLIKKGFFNDFPGKLTLETQIEFALALYVFSLYIPIWFGSSVQSIYRIILLGTPALFLLADWLKLEKIQKKAWLTAGFLIILNILSTYRYASALYLP